MTIDSAYVVDFDGTITTRDITSELAAYYGGSAYMDIENSYRNREIPIRIWLQKIAALLPADLEMLNNKALDWAIIRPGFESLLEHARAAGMPVIVASDGFGFYIEPILKHFDLLGQVSFIYRNETFLNSNNALEVVNPHAHRSCMVCGNCKAAHVVRLKETGRSVIYIGDGSNDRFGASWSDFICARDGLAETCNVLNISCSQWIDFYDIIKIEKPGIKDRSEISLCSPLGDGLKT